MLSSESLFLALPLRLQRLVDEAFDLTADKSHTEWDKVRTKPQQDQTLSVVGAGGFLVESHESHSNTSIEHDILDHQWRSNISLSSIPSALQLLDLPPDDSDILSVFKNAASGWTSGSITSLDGLDPQEKYVSREDWRSVCAVLLEPRNNENSSDNERSSRMSNSGNWQDVELDSEGYMESGSDSTGSSSDEYTEHRVGRRTRVQDHKSQFPLLQLDLRPQHLSSAKKETCLKTFALFFPEVPYHELTDHRIMIKDLQRVSKLLGEKIKAEEMVEMLSTFSTSPDKSISFKDFSSIMILAKLA